MQSKTSFFNGTLFRKNLTRFWPLWGLASFLAALFPLALLVKVLRDGTYLALPGDPAAPELTRIYYSVVGDAAPVLFLIYGALCALAVWSYLYSPRSVGHLHTLPIRREGLFLTSFLSGLAMVLIPCAVAGVLSVLTSFAAGAFDPVGLAITVLAVLGQAFFFFASATLVCFITGNAFAMAPVYFLLHFLAVILDWLVSAFARGFIFGFDDYSTGAVEWLSPAVYLQNHLGVISHQEEVERVTAYGERYTGRVLVSVEPENFHLIALYALAGLALTALAVLLYRRRRSESAGDVVAVGALKPVFRYGLAALAALLGGQFLYSLFWGSFQSGRYFDALPLAVSMVHAAGQVPAGVPGQLEGDPGRGPGLRRRVLRDEVRPAGRGGPGAGGRPAPDPGGPDRRQLLHPDAGAGQGPGGTGPDPSPGGGGRRGLHPLHGREYDPPRRHGGDRSDLGEHLPHLLSQGRRQGEPVVPTASPSPGTGWPRPGPTTICWTGSSTATR